MSPAETMTDRTIELKNIALEILRSQTVAEEITAANHLALFYRTLEADEKLEILKTNESTWEGGIALSSYDAAICLDEPVRTTRFIKGVYMAMQELQQRFPNEELNVLYAGCGPYATLLFPLLPLLDLPHFNITFLDIHASSLQCVTQLLKATGFEQAIKLTEDNALTYRSAVPLHLVVTETMFQALKREPQVGITKNLAPQLVDKGILVPEAIHIDLVYTFFAYEPFFRNEVRETVYTEKQYAHRRVAERVFTVSKSPDFFAQSPNDIFLSKIYTLPADLDQTPDICVFTTVKVFNNIVLGSADSTITNPFSLHSVFNFNAQATFQLVYNFSKIPDWEIKKPAV